MPILSSSCNVILVGNIARIEVTFAPDSGTVDQGDVTLKLRDPHGEESSLTPVVEDSTNVFSYDYEVPEDSLAGTWWVRAESNAPSPRISGEASFEIKRSRFAAP